MRVSARRTSALSWVISSLVVIFCVPARASLQLCNRTSYVVYAATAVQQADFVLTRGWMRLFPGDCATAIDGPLHAPAYFVYARSPSPLAAAYRSWGGQFQFCVQTKGFTLRERVSASRCDDKDAFEAPFAPIETAGATSWTMTFTEEADLNSPGKARAAGLRRLLDSLGYRTGNSDKALSEALTRFRIRAKLASSIPADSLFDALESEATKIETLQGYTVCNDGNADFWAALGMRSGADVESRGWWDVSAGKCMSPIESVLGRDPVYLFVSKQGKARLVSGSVPFCITNRQFDIRGQDRCASRGYQAAGFLPTNLNGSPGFIAHVGNDGLIGAQARTPK